MNAPAKAPQAIDATELYAAGVDLSDYAERVAPAVRALAAPVGRLLDVGAGGGQLGLALSDPALGWTAIEPNPAMRARLLALPDPPRVIDALWRDADLVPGAVDTVLASNVPPHRQEPEAFLAACRRWAARSVVWAVNASESSDVWLASFLPPDQRGPRPEVGLYDILQRLAADPPHEIRFVDWTYRCLALDLSALGGHVADRLGWTPDDPRRPGVEARLRAAAVPGRDGPVLELPRKTAVLFWRQP